ncbi:DNA-binding transcriptional MerR regulator [Mycobacterium frederiksbergense]|uniref:DNA-binding transcriptional MerR regulator n=1 Tax=Mycolicibacterium frederiksbergense TaxID=117567 RepID=A0ABT6KV57_9MYCO|nr:MerR family transcriptional regulator [Mycolicibacterium frederiksbergense]MDH6194577.1 DNA-binding transcriptional MerR regulator [Mycolicibacterium frederiksbergense]
MTDYRLEDLARLSGVSTRNIRAYRERGLLDPPRRVGRSAYYGEQHLAQLTAISQLLAKGFNSAHIAEFFAGLRSGQGLADTLGVQRSGWRGPEPALGVDPAGEEVRTLIEFGLAHIVDGAVELTDPQLGAIVSKADDQRLCLRVMAHIARSEGDAIDRLAEATVAALAEWSRALSAAPLGEIAQAVVADVMDRAMRTRLAATAAE